jgi:hypothetical protein
MERASSNGSDLQGGRLLLNELTIKNRWLVNILVYQIVDMLVYQI